MKIVVPLPPEGYRVERFVVDAEFSAWLDGLGLRLVVEPAREGSALSYEVWRVKKREGGER